MPPTFTDPLPTAPRPAWLRLTDLLIAALLVLALALITSFLATTSAHAQGARELRIGHAQKHPQAMLALFDDAVAQP